MFPNADPSLVQEVYLGLTDRNHEKSIELLVELSKGNQSEQWETSLRVAVDDIQDFPNLSSKLNSSTVSEPFTRASSYKERLLQLSTVVNTSELEKEDI
jgi:hypothetical protein